MINSVELFFSTETQSLLFPSFSSQRINLHDLQTGQAWKPQEVLRINFQNWNIGGSTRFPRPAPKGQIITKKCSRNSHIIQRQKPIKGRSLAQFVDGLKNEPSYILAWLKQNKLMIQLSMRYWSYTARWTPEVFPRKKYAPSLTSLFFNWRVEIFSLQTDLSRGILSVLNILHRNYFLLPYPLKPL